jgi:hypothetical protein
MAAIICKGSICNRPPALKMDFGFRYPDIPDDAWVIGKGDACSPVRIAIDSVLSGPRIPLPVVDTGDQYKDKPRKGVDSLLGIKNETDFVISVYVYGLGTGCNLGVILPQKEETLGLNIPGGWEIAARISNLNPAFYVPQLLIQPAKFSYYRAVLSLAALSPVAQNTSAVTSSQAGTVVAADVLQEIAKIRNGRNAPMPAAQPSAANLGGQTGMVVENGTSYALSLFLSGPVSQKIQIAAGGSQTITLSPGSYEIAASVSNSSVIPFYGKEVFGANTQYSEKFYIGSR